MSRKSKYKRYFKMTIVLVICIACSFAIYALSNVDFNVGNKFSKSSRNELKKILFSTNGKITSDWLVHYLSIKKHVDLFELNIVDLQKQLEQVPQIRRSCIEKRYPDTLFIKLEERQPILKVMARSDGKNELFLIDRLDGHLFSPVCFDSSEYDSIMPVNLTLKKSGMSQFQFLPINGVHAIDDLLSVLREDYPDILKNIKYIDLRNYDHRKGAVWSRIVLRMKNGISIIMSPYGFNVQLLRLEFLLKDKCANNLFRIKKIDVSAVNDVLVEYK